ncbi:MAG TPA: alpha/beta fold hydrolase [Kofleriaceae bacterium]|nr:alpha/beta fold hydrolase [Kofleriaceae bacterium]
MASILDSEPFNQALFFPRGDASPPPPGAIDRFAEVGGARVHVRAYAAPGARCTLLLFHGNGEVVADYDAAAERFAAIGAALAVAEFRGYGQSTGAPTLRAVIDDARPLAELVPGERVIVMGRSLGGAAAHELFARPTARIAGVVLESAFCDLGRLIARRGIAPPAAFTADERATFSPTDKLARGRLPLLVLHGAADTIVRPDEARAAHDAATAAASRALVYVPGRGHNDVSRGDEYWAALAGFVAHVAA